jgi:sulfur-carrier protein adenylyltransferase/sulfurtransferase
MSFNQHTNRYDRQIRLLGFGDVSQEKILKSKVLVIGAGALGCPVLSYLAGAGLGQIGIVDGDKIDLSNLHRQTLYAENEIGKSKAEVARTKLMALNSEIQIEVFPQFLNAENIQEIASNYDILIDGTDNFPTRYLVNDYCVLKGKVNVHGSIQQYSGQVSVFNYLNKDGFRGPNYRDLFPHAPHPSEVVSCAEGGVIGALPGIIGAMMALETIKIITGIGEVLTGRIYQYDGLSAQSQLLTFAADTDNPLTGLNPTQFDLIDYADFCGLKEERKMKSIDVFELKAWMDSGEDFQLIDVREIFEFEEANIGADLIPLGEIPTRHHEISKDKKVVIHCKMGGRSSNAIQYLEQNHGFQNLYNLEGGILAWLDQN